MQCITLLTIPQRSVFCFTHFIRLNDLWCGQHHSWLFWGGNYTHQSVLWLGFIGGIDDISLADNACFFFFFFISKWHSFTLESTHSFINEVTNLGTVTKLSTLTCKEKLHLYENFADNEWQLVMLNNSTSFTAGNFYAPINY